MTSGRIGIEWNTSALVYANDIHAGFEAFTAMRMQVKIFRVVTPCSVVPQKTLTWMTFILCRMSFNTTTYDVHLPPAVVITCHNIFKNFFTFAGIEILTHCAFTILLDLLKLPQIYL
jgi:hypothetical protein